MTTLLQKIEIKIVELIGKCTWKLRNGITPEEQATIRQLLAENYYIILTRNNNHLSTYMINISDFLIGNGWSYWVHGLLNLEDMTDPNGNFELVESTAVGVHVDTFADIFALNSTVLLKPKSMPIEDWTKIVTQAIADVGKPYDYLFNINQTSSFSCVEFVRNALQADPDYATNYANFEALVQKFKRVTPQMLYECGDFEVVYEVRH